MKNSIIILIIVAAVFAIGIFMYMNNPTPSEYQNGPNEEEPVFCTQDAMLCPDGSYVGRVAPNCEFAQCPIPKDAVMEDGTIMEAEVEASVELE